jgi:Tol biopolymer transport system component
MRRTVSLLACAALAGVLGGASTAQSPEQTYLGALDAWNTGRYPDALRELSTLANGPSAGEFHERIALLTGELFITTEITTDGRNPRVSSTGEHVAYETGPVGDGAVTRVVSVRPTVRVVAELPTSMAAFDPSGKRLAWVRTGQAGTPNAQDVVIRNLATGSDTALPADGLLKTALTWTGSGDGVLFIGAAPGDATRSDIFVAREGNSPVRLTNQGGHKAGMLVDPTGAVLAYSESAASPFGGRGAAPPTQSTNAVVIDLKTMQPRVMADVVPGSLTMSADGSTLAWIGRAADGVQTIYAGPPLSPSPTTIRAVTAAERATAPALSPDGRLLAYQFQPRVGSSTDWEIYVSDRSGGHRRITRDIQHDVLPRFLDNRTLLGLIGEPRHRRSHLYDLDAGTRTRVFHGNTIRTISPEYAWAPTPDGRALAIQADRDGDVVSAARGIYLVDLTRKVTPSDLSSRLQAQRRHEADLRNRMTEAFRPITASVRQVVAQISESRVYACHRAMADFDSKNVSQPGNLKAIDYLQKMYASFGYTPEVQWLKLGSNDGQQPIQTANVVATLRGSVNPNLIYIVSSHFDSVSAGTGADDNTSGTCALLEAARVLSRTPLPATVVFASFTGEESGLLGSREFVRLASERKWQVAGALNNDMIGWSADGARIDNTIRYSNAGIRDIQHGAAFLFSDLVLFDSRYYLGTDASTFNEVWGDIVGGIGSYPILANPNYHQPSDLIETINFRQVAETAKVTTASVFALASSPARLKNLAVARKGDAADVTWTASPEAGVTSYVVTYGPPASPQAQRVVVKVPRATLASVPAGTHVAVKAVNGRGLESWDWARAVVK